MRKLGICIALLLFSVTLSAAATPFNFATIGSNNTSLGNSVTVGDVTAEGFVITGSVNGGTYTPNPLWERNDNPADHGIGVCSSSISEGATNCKNNGGDFNELSNEDGQQEAIRLTLAPGATWTQLWVSSLDPGGSNNNESGILYWSNSPTSFTNSFNFSFNDFSPNSETTALLSLAPASFNNSATYLLFINNAGNGGNNDYLVWGGQYTSTRIPPERIPEPGTLALLGAALGGLALRRRKSV